MRTESPILDVDPVGPGPMRTEACAGTRKLGVVDGWQLHMDKALATQRNTCYATQRNARARVRTHLCTHARTQ